MSSALASFRDDHPGLHDFRAEVLAGLSSHPRRIPPRYFYDERGSQLFDAICELDEYYPTRTELSILERCASRLRRHVARRSLLVELGSGASLKVRTLLAELRPKGYLGVDISRDFLLESTRRLAEDYPWLEVHAACADFSDGLDLPLPRGHEEAVAFFPGSSIGNFEPDVAVELLRNIAALVGTGGHLLIGVDLKKDVRVLNAAYNDENGITAAFNRNLLLRMRNELGADLDLEAFEHYAFYNPGASRVEMHLVSTRAATIELDGERFRFEPGEGIHTENSYKYTLDEFERLAQSAGFAVEEIWTDDRSLFSVQLLGSGA